MNGTGAPLRPKRSPPVEARIRARRRHNQPAALIAAPSAVRRAEQGSWITVALWVLLALDAVYLVNGMLAMDPKYWPFNRVRPDRKTERAHYTSANNGRSSATREERIFFVSYCQQLVHLGHDHDVTLAHHCVTILWALGVLRDAGYTFEETGGRAASTFSNQSKRTSGRFYGSGGERASKTSGTATVRRPGQEPARNQGAP